MVDDRTDAPGKRDALGIQGEQGEPGEDGPPEPLDRVAIAVQHLSSNVQELATDVQRDAELREQKIDALGKVLKSLVGALVLLLVLAAVNVYNTTVGSNTARNAQQTNELLVGCFTPGSTCQRQNAENTKNSLNEIRRTQLVIAKCQRDNPLVEDPTGVKVLACVRDYYPDLTLPDRTDS